MVLRQRIKKTIKVLDAFQKVEGDFCQERSPVSGFVSLFSYIVILSLIVVEFTTYFFHSNIVYKFLPDTDFDAKLKFNVDITVAMPCHTLGADILDSTGQNIIKFGQLTEEDTWFELEPAQRIQFEHMQNVNAYLSNSYLHVHEFLWQTVHGPFNEIPPRKNPRSDPFDACRIHGHLELNKVAGNFHITAGKSLQLPQGHVHVSAFITDQDYNFTHRIRQFSFGEHTPGIIQPLEGDEKITTEGSTLYQYFVEVVPTEVDTLLSRQSTYQYSTKSQERNIDHIMGSHGVPGLFFKYDMSALKVRVVQERDSLAQFLVRLCATVGGVHVTSGLIASFLTFITCKSFLNNLIGQETY